MKYKLIIFDWDGTLINSVGKIVECLQLTIKELKFAPKSDKQAQDIIGLGLEEAIFALMPEVKANPELLNLVVETYRKHFFSSKIPDSPLFEGVENILKHLKGKGYVLAIATGKSLRGLERDIECNQVGQYFSAMKTADLTQSKPHPQMLHDIMQELGFEKNEVVVIGDTSFDLEMANNANVDSIAVCSGVHDKKLLSSYNPIAVLSDVTELPRIL